MRAVAALACAVLLMTQSEAVWAEAITFADLQGTAINVDAVKFRRRSSAMGRRVSRAYTLSVI